MDHGGARRALFLGALIALDAAGVVVFRFALLPSELDAVDAAVARVEHGEVIDHATTEAGAAGSVRADPVEIRRDELLVLRERLTGGERQHCRAGQY